MPYPVRLVGGTDNVQPNPPHGRVYQIGERIDDMSDETRLHLQMNGVRFETIHDDTPPLPTDEPAPVLLPADQAAVNEEIAAAVAPKADKASPAKKGDA